MKILFSILLFFTFSVSFAQLSMGNGTSGTSNTGYSDAEYAALGTSNGCQDGAATAFSPNWANTHDSIVYDSAINIHYREAYGEAFMSCRNTTQNGNPVDGGLSDAVQAILDWFLNGGSGGNQNP